MAGANSGGDAFRGEFFSWKRFDLPAELRLILACLRITPEAKEVRQIEELSRAKIDWPDFLRWVGRHRVAPLVYQNLRRYGGSGVPAAAMSALRARFERNVRRSHVNAGELVRLYKLFQENGIEVLPLKGSLLALQVYGNLARRHAGDIDLLVEPGQMEQADRLLQTSYRRIMPDFRLTPSEHWRFLRLRYDFEYLHNQSNRRLELHWRAFQDQPAHVMDLTRLRSRASTVAVADKMLPALSLPDNLLYLCGHGAAHSWGRLFWLADLAEIIRGHPEIDWPRLLILAREAGMMRPLALGVILAHELLDAPLPEVMRNYALQDQVVSYLAKVAYRSMLCPQSAPSSLSWSLLLFTCRLRCAHSLPARLNILLKTCTGSDWMILRLPDFLFFLYYLLRLPLWLQRKLCGRWSQRVRNKTWRKDD